MSDETGKLLKQINLRRHSLRMSLPVLSKRSGVSVPTIGRMLAGELESASFGNVLAVLKALGLTLDGRSAIETQRLREEQARKKARKLVGMVQGTSGLEAQAVGEEIVEQMVEQTIHELLAGSPRKLWAE